MRNAIVVKNICKNYEDFSLDHVSFRVPEGSIVGFIGENGAGKSTTIRAILDLIRLDGGSVEVLGLSREERQDPAWREQIGVVFDVGHIPDLLTAGEMDKVMSGIYRQWDSQTYFRYLKQFKLAKDKKYKDFSRGMKMKLSIAAALSHKAKLLLLDEPTGGLDPVVRDQVVEMFYEFTREEDHSILISSHIVSDLERLCDYVAFLHKGKLLLCEEKDALLDLYCCVHCTAEQLVAIPAGAVLHKRETPYGIELVMRRENVPAELAHGPISVEELFVTMVKEADK